MKVKIKSPIKGENKTVEVEVKQEEAIEYTYTNNKIGTYYGDNPTEEEIKELYKKVYENYFKNLTNNKK